MPSRREWDPRTANGKIGKWAEALEADSVEYGTGGSWELSVSKGEAKTVARQEREGAPVYVDGVRCRSQMDAIAAMESALENAGGGARCFNEELGRQGEEAAARYLELRGYEILARNWSCQAGEADIVAIDDEALVFVDVESRRASADKGLPDDTVDEKKRERFERIAAAYIETFDGVDFAVRFDVVSVLILRNDRVLLRHHAAAFSTEG